MKEKILYKVFGVLWEINVVNPQSMWPLCDNCRMELAGGLNEWNDFLKNDFLCIKCGKQFYFKGYDNLSYLRADVVKHYKASLRHDYTIITLDVPPTKVKVNDEDEYYVMWGNMTQLDGKRLALMYIAEKGGKDKVQLFIDMDNKQLRHDPANIPPKELLAKITCEFDDGTVIEHRYKNGKN